MIADPWIRPRKGKPMRRTVIDELVYAYLEGGVEHPAVLDLKTGEGVMIVDGAISGGSRHRLR